MGTMGVRGYDFWVYTKGVHMRFFFWVYTKGVHLRGCTRVYTTAVRGYDFFLALALS
jgi:hypothetical protein